MKYSLTGEAISYGGQLLTLDRVLFLLRLHYPRCELVSMPGAGQLLFWPARSIGYFHDSVTGEDLGLEEVLDRLNKSVLSARPIPFSGSDRMVFRNGMLQSPNSYEWESDNALRMDKVGAGDEIAILQSGKPVQFFQASFEIPFQGNNLLLYLGGEEPGKQDIPMEALEFKTALSTGDEVKAYVIGYAACKNGVPGFELGEGYGCSPNPRPPDIIYTFPEGEKLWVGFPTDEAIALLLAHKLPSVDIEADKASSE